MIDYSRWIPQLNYIFSVEYWKVLNETNNNICVCTIVGFISSSISNCTSEIELIGN